MSSPITVVKIGGSTLGRHDTSLADIAALHAAGRRFVVVHGGGATISDWLAKHGVESRFVRGLRATDEAALEVVVAVLAGLVNKRLVVELEACGAPACGISGADVGVLRARRYDAELGYVGEVVAVNAEPLRAMSQGVVVALAPIAVEVDGETLRPQLLNVNADTAAGEVAAALPAERLVFLTDVAGVMDASGVVRSQLSPAEARDLLEGGVVTGGMIPKVQAALRAAAAGVPTEIADGTKEGALRVLLAQDAAPGAADLAGTRIG